MFDVRLYSFSKKRNSTARPSGGTVYQCVSNEHLDILSPRLPLNITAEPSRFNYAFVPVFNRYYWITGWTYENGLWVASMSVDELASWKTQIGSQTVYVLRSAVESDGSIIDTTYPATTSVNNASTGSRVWTFTDDEDLSSGRSYVVTVAGIGRLHYYYMTISQYVDFCTAIFSDSFLNDVTRDWEDFASQATVLFNPIQYITSVKAFPFRLKAVEELGNPVNVKLGWWSVPNSEAHELSDLGFQVYHTFTIDIPKHPQSATRGKYLNAAPFTKYDLSIPPWGFFNLDPSTMIDSSTITVRVHVDMFTGMGYLEVYSRWYNNAPDVIYFGDAKVAVDISLSQVAIDYSSATRSLGGLISTGIGKLGQVLSKKDGALGQIGDAMAQSQMKVQTIGAQGGYMAWAFGATLYAEFHEVTDEDIEHRGRPLCQEKRLDTLDGYILVSDPDISLPCTSTELDAIMEYLSTGFFME